MGQERTTTHAETFQRELIELEEALRSVQRDLMEVEEALTPRNDLSRSYYEASTARIRCVVSSRRVFPVVSVARISRKTLCRHLSFNLHMKNDESIVYSEASSPRIGTLIIRDTSHIGND